MGYREAIEDGIEVKKGIYMIPCSQCGIIVQRTSYIRGRKYTCKLCKGVVESIEHPELSAKKEERFNRAVNRIKKKVNNFDDYQKAIETVYKTLHRSGWYGSTEEIMVAIELLQKGVRTIHQQKIGRYHVDFVLPDYKVLLEIDGKPFHNESTLQREGMRDGIILMLMGADWEMIRIDTGKINKDITKLLPSIMAVLESRKEDRKRLKK